MTLAIQDRPQTALAQANTSGNPIAAMLQTIISNDITADTAATMEKLTELYLKVEAENARKAFARAKAQLQAELPSVVATRIIPNNDGSARSTFAAYEDIMRTIQPKLVEHGFSVSFTFRYDTSGKAERLCAVCQLSHIDGHSETNEFAVRVSEPPKASGAQGDGATHTYAKRYALCAALNISIDKDNDARIEGEVISPDEAAELERRCEETGSDKTRFLKYAGAATFAEIRSEKLRHLHDTLDQKSRKPQTDPAAESWDTFAKEVYAIAEARKVDPDLTSAALGKLKMSPMSRPSNTKDRSDFLAKFAGGAKLGTDGTLN